MPVMCLSGPFNISTVTYLVPSLPTHRRHASPRQSSRVVSTRGAISPYLLISGRIRVKSTVRARSGNEGWLYLCSSAIIACQLSGGTARPVSGSMPRATSGSSAIGAMLLGRRGHCWSCSCKRMQFAHFFFSPAYCCMCLCLTIYRSHRSQRLGQQAHRWGPVLYRPDRLVVHSGGRSLVSGYIVTCMCLNLH